PPPRTWRERVRNTLRDVALLGAVALFGMPVVAWLRGPELPEVAPGFTLRDVEGQAVSLADYQGQTVVLNFWATWCGPCRLEAPVFAQFAEAHPDVPVLGLAVDGPVAKVQRVADELGMDYRVVMADPDVVRAYDVDMYPTTVVVGPDGDVQWSHAGIMFRPHLAWATGHLW
ncbi:MAG: TlpA disulfide reductase family protein, partial [Myxococcota bacterium]